MFTVWPNLDLENFLINVLGGGGGVSVKHSVQSGTKAKYPEDLTIEVVPANNQFLVFCCIFKTLQINVCHCHGNLNFFHLQVYFIMYILVSFRPWCDPLDMVKMFILAL